MGRKSSRQKFNEAACLFYAGVKAVSQTYSDQGVTAAGMLIDTLMDHLFAYRQKLSGFNANLEEATHYFGTLSTGQALEMLDHEHGVLERADVPHELPCTILELFQEMDQYFGRLDAEAPRPLDGPGRGILLDLREVSGGLLEKIRHLKTLSLCMIYEAEDFCDWQRDVLMQDVDRSYGKFEMPWGETELKPVMERRQRYIDDMSVQYANILMLHEDILDDLGNLRWCAGKMAGEAERMSRYYLNRVYPGAALAG